MTNEQKLKTVEERVKAFRNHCNPIVGNCGTRCRMSEPDKSGGYDMMKCFAYWLTLEAEEETPMPCPFCGRETYVNTHSEGHEVRCKTRYCYVGRTFEDKAEAIAAHNRVCRAVKDFLVLEKMKIELLNIAHNGSKTTVAEIVEKYLTVKGEDSNKE